MTTEPGALAWRHNLDVLQHPLDMVEAEGGAYKTGGPR